MDQTNAWLSYFPAAKAVLFSQRAMPVGLVSFDDRCVSFAKFGDDFARIFDVTVRRSLADVFPN